MILLCSVNELCLKSVCSHQGSGQGASDRRKPEIIHFCQMALQSHIHSHFLIICSILFVHAHKEVKYPTPVGPPPPLSVPLHSSVPALPSFTMLTSPTPPDLPFFSCLLFSKVWLSISGGLRQQALMKRPLRQGDPN